MRTKFSKFRRSVSNKIASKLTRSTGQRCRENMRFGKFTFILTSTQNYLKSSKINFVLRSFADFYRLCCKRTEDDKRNFHMIQVIIIINRNSQNRVSKNSISKGLHNTPSTMIIILRNFLIF